MMVCTPRLISASSRSPEISSVKRVQRQHRMQRSRSSTIRSESGTALSKWALGKSYRLAPGPYWKVWSWSGHSPPLSQMGQSSGWLIRRNSSTPFWCSSTLGVRVRTTMPSATYTAQAGWSLGIFSTSIRHIRQTATGSILECEQKMGMSIPSFLAASRISVPLGTVTLTPSTWRVTWSVATAIRPP